MGKPVQNWQTERESFAGSGLCDADQIAPLEGVRNVLGLDGCGSYVRELIEKAVYLWRKSQSAKALVS